MKTYLLILALFFISGGVASAQCGTGMKLSPNVFGSQPPFICVSANQKGPGAPTNPCPTAGINYTDTTNNVFYICPSAGGNWFAVGGVNPLAAIPTSGPISGVASLSLTATQIGQGVNPIMIVYNNANPIHKVQFDEVIGTNPGDRVLNFNPAFTGTWVAYGGTGGFSDPLTTDGDINYKNGSTTTRLAKGADNSLLGVDAAAHRPAYTNLTNPPNLMYNQGGTGAVARTMDAKFKDTVSILDFVTGGAGTIGSPWTGWDTAIAAFNGNMSINFPCGYYNAAGVVNLSTSGASKINWTLNGQGRDCTILQWSNTGDGIFSGYAINGTHPAYTTIAHMTLTNSNGANTGGGIDQVDGTYITVDDVKVTGFLNGVIFDQTEVSSITNSEFKNQLSGGRGIWIVNGPDHTALAGALFTNRIRIVNNQINEPVTNDCIDDDGGVDHTIENNNINACKIGVRGSQIWGGRIVDNEIEQSPGNTFSAIVFLASTSIGTTSGNSTGVTISNNSILTGTTSPFAVDVSSLVNSRVANNKCRGGATACVGNITVGIGPLELGPNDYTGAGAYNQGFTSPIITWAPAGSVEIAVPGTASTQSLNLTLSNGQTGGSSIGTGATVRYTGNGGAAKAELSLKTGPTLGANDTDICLRTQASAGGGLQDQVCVDETGKLSALKGLTVTGVISGVSQTLSAPTNTTTSVVTIDGTQALTNKSIVGTEINSGLIGSIYGGTGVNNGANTLTLSGNLATTGAFNPTFAIPSSSTWTFPTGGGTMAATFSATTATITPGALVAGACTAYTTTTVTGARSTMAVATSPAADPGASATWVSYVSANDTVSTKVCAGLASTPAATTYALRVIQ